jgi:hypothetical protein
MVVLKKNLQTLLVVAALLVGVALGALLENAASANAASPTASVNDDTILLAPLQALHQDLIGIEAKIEAYSKPVWEYTTVVPNILGDSGDDYNAKLNGLGQKGWEIVAFSPDTGFILKRRVQQ